MTAPRGAAAPLFCATGATCLRGSPICGLSYTWGTSRRLRVLPPTKLHLRGALPSAQVPQARRGCVGPRGLPLPICWTASPPRRGAASASVPVSSPPSLSSSVPGLPRWSPVSGVMGPPKSPFPFTKMRHMPHFRAPLPPYPRHSGRRAGWRFPSGPAPSRPAGWGGAPGRGRIVRITPKQVSRRARSLPSEGTGFINVCIEMLAPSRGH